MCVHSQRLQSGGARPEEQMEGNRHWRGGEGNEPMKAALGSQREQLNTDIGFQTPQSLGTA